MLNVDCFIRLQRFVNKQIIILDETEINDQVQLTICTNVFQQRIDSSMPPQTVHRNLGLFIYYILHIKSYNGRNLKLQINKTGWSLSANSQSTSKTISLSSKFAINKTNNNDNNANHIEDNERAPTSLRIATSN